MANPTQPAKFFEGLPTGPDFEREYETQDTVPIDGSKASLRAFSPFVMRVLPPMVLGEDFSVLRVSAPSSTNGVLTTAPRADYAGAIRSLNQRRSLSEETYQQQANLGGLIPGLSQSSTRDIDADISNSARNQSISSAIPGSGRSRIVPAISNDASALSILLQLSRLKDVPPLCLYINPSTFTVSHAKIAQFQERSRYGYIYQAWGEELTKVSFSCTIGAFIAGRQSAGQDGVASGVQYASKRDSASFQQLMAIFSMYRSSGYIQDTNANATGRQSRANLLIGNTAIEYDQTVYVGHMDSFSYSEEETTQNGGLKFDIDFTAIKVYDTAQPKMSISPENSPGNFYNPSASSSPSSESRLSRTMLGSGSTQLLSAPTIGGAPAQPWAGATVGLPSSTGSVITSRR
jgi:hypothetical protein